MIHLSKRHWLATSALTVALVAASSEARAQDVAKPASDAATPAASTDEVIVTGYRQSLLDAQDIKRSAVGAEDVILAEDISAFPD